MGWRNPEAEAEAAIDRFEYDRDEPVIEPEGEYDLDRMQDRNERQLGW